MSKKVDASDLAKNPDLNEASGVNDPSINAFRHAKLDKLRAEKKHLTELLRLRVENAFLKEEDKGINDVSLRGKLANLRAENRSLKTEVQGGNIIIQSILDILTEVSQTNDEAGIQLCMVETRIKAQKDALQNL